LAAPPIQQLTGCQREIVAEEERLRDTVREAISLASATQHRSSTLQRQMRSLHQEVQSAKGEDFAALAAESERVRGTARHADSGELPDLAMPYFAHMQLESERGTRDILLGQRTFIDAKRGITIVDWREAPVAQVFFHFSEGEDYEQELPGRCVEGVVLKRRIVVFSQGELIELQTPEGVLRRPPEGEWTTAEKALPRFEGGTGGNAAKRIIGTGQSGQKLPVISSLLDEQQYRALTRDAERPLLVLGGAGCGKTTVALHRLAYLAYQEPGRFAPRNCVVIVPEEGLVRLTRSLLEELNMGDARVLTVDEWFAEQARKLFPELPQRLSSATPPAVSAIKRHPALAALLPEIAWDAAMACAQRIDRQLDWTNAFESEYRSRSEPIPLARLVAARDAFVATALAGDAATTSRFNLVFDAERRGFEDIAADRERLCGDREILDRAVRDSNGDLRPSMLDRLIDHTRTQFALTAEEEYADIDAARRTSIDGRTLDSGTPTEDAGTIDVEEFALLLELQRQKTGHFESSGGRLASYGHLLLDEAQELSSVELGVLGSAVGEHGCLTVAGDSAQQIGSTERFLGWDLVMSQLGHEGSDPVMLETSYRCTSPIIDFAHTVLGPFAPEARLEATKDGAPVAHSVPPSWLHAEILLGESLAELLDREPRAQVAIIAREDERARKLHDTLRHQLPVRLVLDGRFSFQPGIDITAVPQVKGLEFDYVVIPDATPNVYPDDPVSRRMLHVAATRAVHQLWVVAVGQRSSLLPAEQAP
jgi:DNA helicase-2/ATP-dependent DNA helicase PcrA